MIFHAWNRAQELRRPLLISASAAPPLWQIALPDLASRLKATPIAGIGAPDDALLTAVMSKQFHDRGLQPAPEVVHYILARIERSFAGIADRSEEHTSELQSLMRNSYAVFCLNNKKHQIQHN